MKIDLYEHNETAYKAAVEMLKQTGKAAIIHPTGTGKSFIAFRLCADNPDSRVCWLSPSEYIYRTQLQNLAQVTGGELPDNIAFLTYARLMSMDDENIEALSPDYIILDEFHRCGAQQWGTGVRRLLNLFPDVPVLGLSATNIRYLDNQRDMADELFDGCIASEMTLGEAIVRGILNPPKYVLTLFSYGQELAGYEARISRCRSRAVRDEAEKLLQQLRRRLENSEGLDEIFLSHMPDPRGKYIVFCANKEHMDEMMGHLEWFALVDPQPRVYSVYTGDAGASQSFDDFRKDCDETHLRLLYCIDALNEGIHLDDIDGVILLRPTVSPIIYRQQIGRALSAGTSHDKTPVIFDIVMNIENLYSIGAVQDEMEIATAYYRTLGEEESIVNENFQVIDEVRDCRLLFERLNNTLTASWDLMYDRAKAYSEEYGDLMVPARYVTADGCALGRWISNQRAIKNGQLSGNLSEDRIRRLDEIGMVWQSLADMSWDRNYAAAQRYAQQYGDLEVPAKYITDEGIHLGSWLATLRTWQKAGIHQKYLTPERIESLNKLGMIWNVLDSIWERNFQAAEKYFEEYGDLNVSSAYISPDGTHLGTWIGRLRGLRSGRMRGTPPTAEQIRRLNSIGMVWSGRGSARWEQNYQAAVKYYDAHGDLLVPVSYVTDNGLCLGSWIQRQRQAYHRHNLSDDRQKRLDAIGMAWRDSLRIVEDC